MECVVRRQKDGSRSSGKFWPMANFVTTFIVKRSTLKAWYDIVYTLFSVTVLILWSHLALTDCYNSTF